jgi:hypothetical protein
MKLDMANPFHLCCVGAVFGAIIFGTFTLYSVFFLLSDLDQYRLQYFMICITGWAVGWVTSFLYSPHGSDESEKASKVFAIVGTFLTGYAVSKLDPLITAAMLEANRLAVITGFLFFSASFLTTFIIVFVYRRYIEKPFLIEQDAKRSRARKQFAQFPRPIRQQATRLRR